MCIKTRYSYNINIKHVSNIGDIVIDNYEKTLLEKYREISDKQAEAVGRRNYEHLQEILIHIKFFKRWNRTGQ